MSARNKGKSVSKVKRKWLVVLCLLSLCQACSTTTSDSRSYLENAGTSRISSSAMFFDRSQLITASQEGGGLFKLHHSAADVQQMVTNVASKFGFQSVQRDQASYVVELKSAFPDGGACENEDETAGSNASFTASVLTFGILPASMSHCYLVSVALYERIDGEWLLIGEFFSNQGRVNVYAGANEVQSYSLIVTKRDEALGLETSIAALFKQMVDDGAFE